MCKGRQECPGGELGTRPGWDFSSQGVPRGSNHSQCPASAQAPTPSLCLCSPTPPAHSPAVCTDSALPSSSLLAASVPGLCEMPRGAGRPSTPQGLGAAHQKVHSLPEVPIRTPTFVLRTQWYLVERTHPGSLAVSLVLPLLRVSLLVRPHTTSPSMPPSPPSPSKPSLWPQHPPPACRTTPPSCRFMTRDTSWSSVDGFLHGESLGDARHAAEHRFGTNNNAPSPLLPSPPSFPLALPCLVLL